MSKFILFFSVFLIVFFVSINFSKIGYLSMFYDVGWLSDHLFLTDYVETGKILRGGNFSIDKYRLYNQSYGNIFAYFEIPADSGGSLVSLKGVGRLFLKAPLFFFAGAELFWAIWKTISLICIAGFFLIYLKTLFRKRGEILLGFFSFIFFGSYFAFDLEFGCLFVTCMSLIIYFNKKKNFYLFLFFLFGLYTGIMRTDFFLFLSFLNILVLLHFLFVRNYTYFFWVFIFSLFITSSTLMLNYEYYGGFMTFGYSLQKDGNMAYLEKSSSFIGKYSKFLLPSGAKIEAFQNLFYVLHSYIGVGLLFLFVNIFKFKGKKYKNLIYFGILVIVLYGIFFYGSNLKYYKPIDPLSSSYNRYFSTFILLLWPLFYNNFFSFNQVIKILYFFSIFIFYFSSQHNFYQIDNKLRTLIYFKEIESVIPANSIILPLVPAKFTLLNYRVLEPSGQDKDQYMNFWLGKAVSFNFLENISRFIQDFKEPIYIIGDNNLQRQMLESFFSKKGHSIIKNKYFSKVNPF